MNKKLSIILISVALVFVGIFFVVKNSGLPDSLNTAPQTENKSANIQSNFLNEAKTSKVLNVSEKKNFYSQQSSNGEIAAPAVGLDSTGSFVENTKLLDITFTAGFFSSSLRVPENSSAYDAMTILASTTALTFKSTYYSGLGYFIKEINNKPNADGAYWTLYINGKYSNVGASQYKLRQGDAIEWKYEKQ